MGVGRPSDYQEKYCTKLINWMARGKSFESFASIIGVCRATLYNWCEVFPEFLDAKKIGTEMALSYWEDLGENLASGVTNGNAAVWIFTMKNRFKDLYTDKQEIENTGRMAMVWEEKKTYEAKPETDQST